MQVDSNDPWLSRRSHSSAAPNRGFNSTSGDSEYQRDRARIIHSASFRSLQSKTQVLGLGESDFYRTRLTHSLEVAQIGSGICEWLRNGRGNPDYIEWIPSFSLIEAICLAHDLGHSPFGHGGEVAMNFMMKESGGFEANGQTLRILSKLGEYSSDCGLDLTRRTALGTIKYPVFYEDVCKYPSRPELSNGSVSTSADDIGYLNIDHWAPPKCLYEDDREVLDWILTPFSVADRNRFLTIEPRTNHHDKSRFKAFDTTIMELADDIAYGVHDLEDALALGLVSKKAWEAQVAAELTALPGNVIGSEIDFFNESLFSDSDRQRKHAISKLVGYFIKNIDCKQQLEFEHPLVRLQAVMDDEAYRVLHLIKNFVMHHVIMRPELQTLQYKGQRVIIRLFEIFAANPKRLLPHEVYTTYQQSESDGLNGYRAIADFIGGMTDVSAGKLYHKLLSPTAGSIFDRT